MKKTKSEEVTKERPKRSEFFECAAMKARRCEQKTDGGEAPRSESKETTETKTANASMEEKPA